MTGAATQSVGDEAVQALSRSVVSIDTARGAETYIFPASAEGSEPLGWRELDGSYRGALDHAVALRGAGYEVQS